MKQMSENKSGKPFGSSSHIMDMLTVSHLSSFNPELTNILYDENIVENFCSEFYDWIQTSKNNTFIGIEKFPFYAYSNGTSESFDKFYIKNNTRRFRCFRTEYMYHQLAWRNSWPNWLFIEDGKLDENDAVVISLPFSDTGNKHIHHDEILNQCDDLGIPVLIDCCFAFVSKGIDFNFNHNCITDIVFSLSKTFPVSYARVGMRLTRVDDDDTLFVYQKISYNNRFGAALGQHFINKFTPDYIVDQYKDVQIDFCKQLNVESSNTVFFGLGGDDWKEYNRGGLKNRLSFHKFMHEKNLKEYHGS